MPHRGAFQKAPQGRALRCAQAQAGTAADYDEHMAGIDIHLRLDRDDQSADFDVRADDAHRREGIDADIDHELNHLDVEHDVRGDGIDTVPLFFSDEFLE